MSAFKHLLNRAHRCSHYCSAKTTRPELSFFLHLRPFSSSPPESTSPPAPEANDLNSSRRNPISIQPVSYEVKKPENPPPPPSADSQWRGPAAQSPPLHPPEIRDRQGNDVRPENLGTWTREDFRYVKDVPNVSPVSYPIRVAPLPEDRVATEEAKEGDGRYVEQGGDDELERERRRIEAEKQGVLRRAYMGQGEKVPFPTLIRTETKKKEKSVYDLKEAIRFVKANAKCKFEETVEAHVKLTPELRKSHLNLTGSVLLPHGCGKEFKIAVFAEGDAAEEAREAGAACVGGKELVDRIKSGEVKFKFDKCFATHDMMVHVKKIGRYLKRGMMPNPEHGTLTDDMSKAVREAISKHIIFQKDKSAIVHVPLGKVNYSEEALRENIGAFANALLHAKPAGLKKTSKYAGYISTFHICSTMGPSVPVTIQSVSMAVDRYNKLRVLA